MGQGVVDPRIVGWVIGYFVLAFAGTMLVPFAYTLLTTGSDIRSFGLALLISVVIGAMLLFTSRHRPAREMKQREGILVVVLVWVAVCVLGALPFHFSSYFASFADALFESVSGFTTTGATVLPRVEALSESILFWRQLSHWLGGMGIVLLAVAILPILGQGGMHLYRAEFSGAQSERLAPRLVETAKALWKIYMVLTLVAVAAYWWAGMTPFDAIAHAFSAVATGGFSTYTASIGAFDSPLIEYLTVVIMLLGGTSFILLYRVFVEHRPQALVRDYEFTYYLLLAITVTLIIFGILAGNDNLTWELAFRRALFQVTAILTTSGFVTDDYAAWYPLSQLLLFALMFSGGCTGSTAGGLKVARLVILSRVVDREFRRMAEPQGVFHIRLGGVVITESTIQGLLNLLYLAWLLHLVASLLLAAMGVDVFTAIAAVTACMFNIGPGLAGVGPAEHYGDLPALAKWVLSGCMIAGRLEYYTTIIILTSVFWRR